MIPLVLLAGSTPAVAATDLVKDIDAAVVSLHDFSIIASQQKQGATYNQIHTTEVLLIKKLATIRANLTTLDTHLIKNWTYLSTAANYTYPDRDTMKKFDTQGFAWYNFQIALHKKFASCLANTSSGVKCLLATKASNGALESKLYNALGKTLNAIEVWRKAAKR